MKPYLLPNLRCPDCEGSLVYDEAARCLTCAGCGRVFEVRDGIPLFTQPPAGMAPSEKLERGPDTGTPWRKANWRFLEQQVSRLDSQALILDAGAGRGDFAALFEGRNCLALDVYPYPEIDLVCDLTLAVPFKPGVFDAVALMNVMEHIYDTHAMLAALSRLLKPGGVLVVAIPFLVKIHQAPVDFVRYTHFALQRLGEEHGLQVESLEGYYDPVFFLGEGIGNLRWAVLPTLRGGRRYFARLLLEGIRLLAGSLDSLLGKGQASSPSKTKSFAPTGYHIVYRKPVV